MWVWINPPKLQLENGLSEGCASWLDMEIPFTFASHCRFAFFIVSPSRCCSNWITIMHMCRAWIDMTTHFQLITLSSAHSLWPCFSIYTLDFVSLDQQSYFDLTCGVLGSNAHISSIGGNWLRVWRWNYIHSLGKDADVWSRATARFLVVSSTM